MKAGTGGKRIKGRGAGAKKRPPAKKEAKAQVKRPPSRAASSFFMTNCAASGIFDELLDD